MSKAEQMRWLVFAAMVSFPILMLLIMRWAPKTHYKVTLGEFGQNCTIQKWVYVIRERWPADAVEEAKRRHGRSCFWLKVEVSR